MIKIAYNILADFEDSKESVNDTYLKAWNSMPSHKPDILRAYLVKITREIAIDVFRKKNSKKRSASQYALSLSEVEECIPDGNSPEQEAEVNLLADLMDKYLDTLSEEANTIFVCRYYHMDSIKDIATNHNMSQSKAKVTLHRTRIGLKNYLEERGFTV